MNEFCKKRTQLIYETLIKTVFLINFSLNVLATCLGRFLEMRKTAETICTDDYEGGKTDDIIGGETTIDPWSDFSLVENASCKKNFILRKQSARFIYQSNQS